MKTFLIYNIIDNENSIGNIFFGFIPLFFFVYLSFFLITQRSKLLNISYPNLNNKSFSQTKINTLILMLITIGYIFISFFSYFPEIKILINGIGLQLNGKIFFFEIFLIIVFCILCYLTAQYRTELKKEHILLFYFFIFAALNLLLQTNLIGIFLLIEMFSLASYVIVAGMGNKISIEGALKYALMGVFSSAILIIALMFLLFNYGTLNLLEIALLENYIYLEKTSSFFIIFCCIFFLISFFFKLAIVPFHQWIVDVYKSASNVSFIWLVSTTKILVFLVLLLIFESLLQNNSENLKYIFSIAGILSLMIGNFGGLIQTNIKGLFAYSSIVTVGFLMVCFIGYYDNVEKASTLGLIYLLTYIFNLLSFLFFVSKIQQKSLLFGNLKYINNVIKVDKIVGFGLIINFFSLLGLPPLIGFLPKILIFYDIYQQSYIITCFLFIFFSLIGSFYYFKIIKRISFFKKTEMTLNETYNFLNIQKLTLIEQIIAIIIIIINIVFITQFQLFFEIIETILK